MLIRILTPIFKCQEDQNIFFSRLRGLPGYESAVGRAEGFHLTLTGQAEQEAIEELNALCDVWNTTFEVLAE